MKVILFGPFTDDQRAVTLEAMQVDFGAVPECSDQRADTFARSVNAIEVQVSLGVSAGLSIGALIGVSVAPSMGVSAGLLLGCVIGLLVD